MKKVLMTLPLLTVCVFLFAIKEQKNSTETLYADNHSVPTHPIDAWQAADLQKVFNEPQVYVFKKTALQNMLAFDNLNEFRFVLGVQNIELTVLCQGLERSGNLITSGIVSTQKPLTVSLPETAESTFSPAEGTAPEATHHVLSSSHALQYLKDWQQASQSNDLERFVSYNGTRIKHYTMNKEAIALLASQDNVNNIALVWGLNAEGKMATVFLGEDANGDLLLPNKHNLALDLSQPCPPYCDPNNQDELL